MPRQPLVSVVVGAYNAGAELTSTLKTILRQQGIELELIVVDDGSTDDTAAQLEALARDDERVRVLRQSNAGLTSALIRGCAVARGDYIARHDIGDRSMPGRLARQARLLDEHPDVAMVTCGYRFVGPNGETLSETLPRYSAGEWTETLRTGDEPRLHGPHHGSVMFRKSAYDAVGGYRPEFYFAQDLDLWTRLAAIGSLDYVPGVLYEVGFGYGSISARHGAQQRQLQRIIALATQRRVRGESDDGLLRQAALVRKPVDDVASSASSVIDADYFIGSCLSVRNDPAARRYLRQVLRRRPFHARAWAKLLRSYVTGAALAGRVGTDD